METNVVADVPHLREDGMIGLEAIQKFIHLRQPGIEDTYEVVTAPQKLREIKQNNPEFSQYYAVFQVIAANHDWDRSALLIDRRMGLSDNMKDSFECSYMPDEHPAFVTVYQEPDNQIRQ
jgi:hypothetical protein